MQDNLHSQYEERIPSLESLAESLKQELRIALEGTPHIDRVSFRVKSSKSFVKKVRDKRNDPPYKSPLTEVDDQIAGRVIVFFIQDIIVVHSQLSGTFNFVEKKERRPAKDEEFGYESYHLVSMIPPHLKPDGWDDFPDMPRTFELQIRTIFMHAWAEPQHDIGYKGSADLPKNIKRELAWIAASAWGADHAYKRICEWNDNKK